MSYHDLSSCTLTPEERLDEAARIFKMFDDGNLISLSIMTGSEFKFVKSVEHADYIGVKQLFWLRDLKAKYLE